MAAQNGHIDVVRLLLDQKAAIDVPLKVLAIVGREGGEFTTVILFFR
jgi:hypothetical protein